MATACSAALLDGRERAILRADVFGIGPNQTIVGALLENVRTPAGQPRDDEYRREKRRGNAKEVIRRGVVEVGIGEQFFLVPHELREARGGRIQRVLVYMVLGRLLRTW